MANPLSKDEIMRITAQTIADFILNSIEDAVADVAESMTPPVAEEGEPETETPEPDEDLIAEELLQGVMEQMAMRILSADNWKDMRTRYPRERYVI